MNFKKTFRSGWIFILLCVGLMRDNNNSGVLGHSIKGASSANASDAAASRASHHGCSSYEKILPKAIIIGVKKSGTYALLRYLSINPQVKAALKLNGCDLNEIHYFDQDRNYEQGESWYQSKMPLVCSDTKNSTIVVEKTPGYFRSEKAPERVFKFDPSIKLILIVRNPVKRVQSDLTHCDVRQKEFRLERSCSKMNNVFEKILKENLTNSSIDQSFRTRMHASDERDDQADNNDNVLNNIEFIRNSLYHVHMKRWLRYFNLSNFFVLNGDDFISRPWIELNKLETFLNLPNYIRQEHFYFDKKKTFYCMRGPRNRTRHSGQGCLGNNKGRKNQVYLSEYVKKGLGDYFAKKNQLFFDLINKKFNW